MAGGPPHPAHPAHPTSEGVSSGSGTGRVCVCACVSALGEGQGEEISFSLMMWWLRSDSFILTVALSQVQSGCCCLQCATRAIYSGSLRTEGEVERGGAGRDGERGQEEAGWRGHKAQGR